MRSEVRWVVSVNVKASNELCSHDEFTSQSSESERERERESRWEVREAHLLQDKPRQTALPDVFSSSFSKER